MKMAFIKEFKISVPRITFEKVINLIDNNAVKIIIFALSVLSVYYFSHYYSNGLGLAYNDARSHLDIGRRVVEGLKPGIAQLGSVWLPLLHILMTLTIWNDFMWHSGLAGAIVSMISFVITGVVIYKYLKEMGIPLLARFLGVIIFVANINVLYLQSTAMTELLLIATMTLGAYELMKWYKYDNTLSLIKSAFWIMLATATRYDGWFLLAWATVLVGYKVFFRSNDDFPKTKNIFKKIRNYFKYNYNETEGTLVMFLTLASFGIFLWLLWNLIIFKDPLYFAFGPFSAKAQQDQLEIAGVLQTKYNLWLSIKFYFYALVYNSGFFHTILGAIGVAVMWFDKKVSTGMKVAASALLAPLAFNILALFMGHSVLFIQGLSGDTWFNVRYGIMLMPSIAIFVSYLVSKSKDLRWVLVGLLFFVTFFHFSSQDAVTIDDARVGSSQKNVSEVSGWLAENAADERGFVLISAASHDAIIFSSGMPMKRFIHEGTGLYWESATGLPDRWARWIIMRTHDDNDLTWKNVKDKPGFSKYRLVDHFPFADIYEIEDQYLNDLNYEAVLTNNK